MGTELSEERHCHLHGSFMNFFTLWDSTLPFCMNYIMPHLALERWQMPQPFLVYSADSLQKKKPTNACATYSWCLKAPFQVPKEETKFKIKLTMTIGMQRVSQILNRNTEKLLSVSLLSESGAVKAFSWAMGSLWNSTANLQTHSGYQRREESSSLCKGSQKILHFHDNFNH